MLILKVSSVKVQSNSEECEPEADQPVTEH